MDTHTHASCWESILCSRVGWMDLMVWVGFFFVRFFFVFLKVFRLFRVSVFLTHVCICVVEIKLFTRLFLVFLSFVSSV